MSQVLGRMVRLPATACKAVCSHPRTAIVVTIALVAGSAIGFWQYARHQWRMAQVALSEDRPAEARDRLGFCLKVWPYSTEVHLLAARAARLNGDINLAEAHLNRCLELQDGATERVQLEFLLIRVQAGEVEDEKLVSTLFDLVQKAHPESPMILETLAKTYIIRLRYKPAYACLSRWIEAEPLNAKAYQWRGWVLERLNNHTGATKDYHRALELDPDRLPVRIRVAEMLLEDKQAPEALPHLERLIRQAPDDPVVQARLGMCRFLQGRSVEARQLMEAAVVHLPHDPSLLVYLANLDLQEGRGVEAERRLRTVLATDSSDTEALFVLVHALQLQGRSDEAAIVLADYEKKRAIVERINEMLKDVADTDAAKGEDYAEIGHLFLQIRRDKLGVYWSERALERDPANQTAHRALASYYERKGDKPRERTHRQQIRVPVTPAPPSSSDLRGPGK